jgi:hypothetical protein
MYVCLQHFKDEEIDNIPTSTVHKAVPMRIKVKSAQQFSA